MSTWKPALDYFGSQAKIARALGTTQATVSRRLAAGKPLSAEDAVALERASNGAVNRAELRPDLWSSDQSSA